jgi:Lipocalin-like domain
MNEKDIAGAWSVLSAVNEVDGKKADLFGPNPQGQFIFTADGHFSINIIRSGRTKFASGNSTAGTAAENKEAMAGTLSLFGTYTINSDGWQTLHIVRSSFPNWDDAEQKRLIQIKGDEMTYGNPTAPTGSGHVVLMLRRAK